MSSVSLYAEYISALQADTHLPSIMCYVQLIITIILYILLILVDEITKQLSYGSSNNW